MLIVIAIIIGIPAYYGLGCLCIKSEVFGLNALGRFIEKKWTGGFFFTPADSAKSLKENTFVILMWPLLTLIVGIALLFTVWEGAFCGKALKDRAARFREGSRKAAQESKAGS